MPIESAAFADIAPAPGSRAYDAYQQMRRRIVELDLPPGAPFTEGALAISLGVSKTPVREALVVLAAEEYVDVLPQTGYIVRPVTLRSINDVFQTQILLEGAAVESLRAAVRTTSEDLAELHARRQKNTASNEEFLADYLAFHFTIAGAAGNRRLRQPLARLLHHHERLLRMCAAQGTPLAQLVGDDQPLLAALQEERWVDAGEAARVRLRDCQETVMQVLLTSSYLLDAVISP
ncbi:MAG TPA: GntR family transcriptional regulator [Jatrophihabitans sp.]